MAVVCTVATALRFLAGYRSGKSVGAEDGFAVASLVAFLAFAGLLISSLVMIADTDPETWSPDLIASIGKIAFASEPMYPLNQCSAKLSILFLYYRLFSVNRAYVRWMYFLGAIQIMDSITSLVGNIFGCMPINYNWDFTVEGSCINTVVFFACTEAINSSVDFALIVLGCFIISKMQLKTSVKIKLSFIFILGGLSGIVGFYRIGQYTARGQEGELGV